VWVPEPFWTFEPERNPLAVMGIERRNAQRLAQSLYRLRTLGFLTSNCRMIHWW